MGRNNPCCNGLFSYGKRFPAQGVSKAEGIKLAIRNINVYCCDVLYHYRQHPAVGLERILAARIMDRLCGELAGYRGKTKGSVAFCFYSWPQLCRSEEHTSELPS